MTKDRVRTTLLRRLRQQEEDERRRRSEAIRRKVFRLTAFRRAKTICCYVALPYEVQTWRMIEEMLARGKRVVVPVTSRGRTRRLAFAEVRCPLADLAPGRFGVWEPKYSKRRRVRPTDVDLWLVPGIAFDRSGRRLGHGQGYYDRVLARLPKTTPTVGLAYRFQLLNRLPAAAHDTAVQTILTA